MVTMLFFFLVSNLNLPPFSLKQLCCLLSCHCTILYKVPIQLSGRCWKAALRSPQGLHIFRVKSPNSFSLSLYRRMVPSLQEFLLATSGLVFSKSTSFLHWDPLVSVRSPLNPVTTSDQNYCCLGEAEHLGVLLVHIYTHTHPHTHPNLVFRRMEFVQVLCRHSQ